MRTGFITGLGVFLAMLLGSAVAAEAGTHVAIGVGIRVGPIVCGPPAYFAAYPAPACYPYYSGYYYGAYPAPPVVIRTYIAPRGYYGYAHVHPGHGWAHGPHGYRGYHAPRH